LPLKRFSPSVKLSFFLRPFDRSPHVGISTCSCTPLSFLHLPTLLDVSLIIVYLPPSCPLFCLVLLSSFCPVPLSDWIGRRYPFSTLIRLNQHRRLALMTASDEYGGVLVSSSYTRLNRSGYTILGLLPLCDEMFYAAFSSRPNFLIKGCFWSELFLLSLTPISRAFISIWMLLSYPPPFPLAFLHFSPRSFDSSAPSSTNFLVFFPFFLCPLLSAPLSVCWC